MDGFTEPSQRERDRLLAFPSILFSGREGRKVRKFLKGLENSLNQLVVLKVWSPTGHPGTLRNATSPPTLGLQTYLIRISKCSHGFLQPDFILTFFLHVKITANTFGFLFSHHLGAPV